ncbi:MAG: SO_0444 family Cu/Zn efflux transporter [Candidatus Omnitrophota bacterium]
MNIILGIAHETYFLLNKMALYLLFGYFFAGVLHIFVNTGTIATHLGKKNFSSVIKASLFGIPLPLCSCSVIPTAMSLKKEGASKGAVLAFLISTPTTGIDSMFATYSLLGPVFTVYRIIAAFITGTIAGIASNLLDHDGPQEERVDTPKCKLCQDDKEHKHGIKHKVNGIFKYAFVDLLKDSGPALVMGLLVGGVITFFFPENIIETYLGSGISSMLLMLVLGIPMYVCATASIPIAAALMLKGLSPGAALVFLIAGPATNIVTMMVVSRNMGKKSLAIYLGSIVTGSLLLGSVLNKVYGYLYKTNGFLDHIHEGSMPQGIGAVSSAILVMLIAYNFFNQKMRSIK